MVDAKRRYLHVSKSFIVTEAGAYDFAVPALMYRAGLVCIHKDIIKEVNKILFNFIWKGKDTVKRSVLISDEENGGLRAPQLESIIRTQRIICCKKFAEAQQSSCK